MEQIVLHPSKETDPVNTLISDPIPSVVQAPSLWYFVIPGLEKQYNNVKIKSCSGYFKKVEKYKIHSGKRIINMFK